MSLRIADKAGNNETEPSPRIYQNMTTWRWEEHLNNCLEARALESYLQHTLSECDIIQESWSPIFGEVLS